MIWFIKLFKNLQYLELSCFWDFCSFTIITESPSWAANKKKKNTSIAMQEDKTEYWDNVFFYLKFTWWLCPLRGVILQSWWGRSWENSSGLTGAEVCVWWPSLGPWLTGGSHGTGEVAGALTWHPSGAGGATGSFWRPSSCWSSWRRQP